MSRKTIKFIIKEVIAGIILGLIYYTIYVLLLPKILSSLLQTPMLMVEKDLPFFLFFFIALGTAESILRNNVVSIPLRILSKLFGALILYIVLNGGIIETSITMGDAVLRVEFDLSILLYTIILVSLIYGFIDAFTFYTSNEEIGR